MFGSQQSGGAIVQSTSPWAALAAGQFGVQAAYQASQAMATQTANALNAVNQAYTTAATTLAPQTQVGVQALDQMSQYLGLKPYMPAQAPTAPTAPTLQSEMAKLTPSQINQYIAGNTFSGGYSTGAGNFGYSDYTGSYLNGTDTPTTAANAYDSYGNKGVTPYGFISAIGPGQYGPANALGNPNVRGGASYDLASANLQTDTTAYNTAQKQYNLDLANYNQDQAWAQQYGTPLTQQQITDNITNLPGYQAQLDQGTQAIENSASSKGYLGSGRVLKELMNFGQNTLSQFYGNTLSQLAGVASMGAQAGSQLAGSATGTGNALANLYTNLGDTQANAALAAGQAQAQGIIGANQNYNIMGQQSSGAASGIGQAIGGLASIASAFSSKSFKDTTSTPSTKEILDKVNQLDLDKWRYKNLPDQEFIGPYAEQFTELFGVGDGKSINLINAVGVLIGAVKELDRKITAISNQSEA